MRQAVFGDGQSVTRVHSDTGLAKAGTINAVHVHIKASSLKLTTT